MENENDVIKDFLGEDVVNPFSDETENPFTHLEGEQEEKPVVKEEEQLPYNKDPKIQKFIEKEISKRLDNFKPEPVKVEQPTSTDPEDDFYVRLIGNDTPEKVAMIREYKAREQKLIEQAEERALSRLTAKEQEVLRAEQEAEQQLRNSLDSIEENYNVDITSKSSTALKTRQEFMAFVEKIAPKNASGAIVDYPDMNSAWETFQQIKTANPQVTRAKELANRSMGRSSETSNKAPQDRISWDAVDTYMDSLK